MSRILVIAAAKPPLPPTDGVRVSGGHICEAEAPTEAAAETVGFAQRAKLGGG